jgi:hypothetical protein
MIVVQVEEVVNQTNVTAQTTEVKVFVRTGDEELSRQFALASQASAIAAGESETNAGASEQVATEKAAQTAEDAAEALASKLASESASTTSTEQAVLSASARNEAEAAKLASQDSEDVSTEQALISTTKATESAASATAAEAAKNQIVDKAEINIVTAGNVLRADGSLFKSVSEVEFLRNINAYRRAPNSKFFDNKQIIAWDNFDRPNQSPLIESDSGHTYSIWKGDTIGRVFDNNYFGNGTWVESTALITFPATKNIGVEFSFLRSTFGAQISAFALVKDLNNYIAFGRFSKSPGLGAGNLFPEIPDNYNYSLLAVINGVATLLGSIGITSFYSGPSGGDPFFGTRLNFVIKYGNRGRSDNSSLFLQSLDNPAVRIEVNIPQFNTTFATPSDYNRIAIIANNSQIMSYKVANLNL